MRGASRGVVERDRSPRLGNQLGRWPGEPAWRRSLVRCGVLRVVARTHASGRCRGPVRAYYEALPLVSWLDAGQVKAAKSAGSVGFDCIAPVPGSTGLTTQNRRGGRAAKALRERPLADRENHHPSAPCGAPPPLAVEGCMPRARGAARTRLHGRSIRPRRRTDEPPTIRRRPTTKPVARGPASRIPPLSAAAPIASYLRIDGALHRSSWRPVDAIRSRLRPRRRFRRRPRRAGARGQRAIIARRPHRKAQRLCRLHQPAVGAHLPVAQPLFRLGHAQERPDRQGAHHLRHLHDLRHVGLPQECRESQRAGAARRRA